MKRNTSISTDLQHVTKFIDPASGKVLREGTTPTDTINQYKTQAPVVEQEDVVTREEFNELKGGIEDIKNLLTNK